MSIRRMEPADHTALLELWRSFPGNAVTGADGSEGFSAFLERNGDFCFVLEEQDKVLGSVMAAHDGRRGYIYHLAVDAGRHGRGFGRALMERAEAALAAAGIEKAHLFIFSDNPAVGFYERTGWHLRRDIEVMSKVLTGSDPLLGTRPEPED
jgi:ribosomal protein S18 acetylase RimI-like enzyme